MDQKMNKKQAIKILSSVKVADLPWKGCRQNQTSWDLARKKAIAALSLPSQEQLELAWPPCNHCEDEWGICDPVTNRFTLPPNDGILFCPMCGRPCTPAGWEELKKKLEVMNDV